LNTKNKKIYNLIYRILKKYKLSSNHSKICADTLVNAELVGAYGHGLSRLKMYCDRISKKLINSKPKIKIKKISQSISHIDANNSIGFVAAEFLTGTTGIGFVENVAKKYFQYEVIWKNIFVMGMIGLIFNVTLRKIIDKTFPWRGKG